MKELPLCQKHFDGTFKELPLSQKHFDGTFKELPLCQKHFNGTFKELPFRQIHLDFHTSGCINDVGSQFDADEFANTLEKANVNSINIFAKGHHGFCYYPSKFGPMHPSLKVDMLGQMIKALHKRGIACPIYYTIGWEEEAAKNLEWLQVDKEGVIGKKKTFEAANYKWRHLCANKPGYIKFMKNQICELMDNYECDGFWFDITMWQVCYCDDCLKEMKQKGYDVSNENDVRKFGFLKTKEMLESLYNFVKGKDKDALVFFNGSCQADNAFDKTYNSMARKEFQTQIEIESLPSEIWGYNHFPVNVAYYNKDDDKQIIGMNGKFHTAWGDFGSLRNSEALDYECFRMIANGAKCSIGDQLHPRGRLDKAAYDLIGKTYAKVKEREEYCEKSKTISQIGIILGNDFFGKERDSHDHMRCLANEGAVRMMLECQYMYNMIDFQTDFTSFELIILPDDVVLKPEHANKLNDYVKNGGRILATYQSGMNETKNEFLLDSLGVSYVEDNPFTPSYIVVDEDFDDKIAPYEYVQYQKSIRVETKEDTKTLLYLGDPYYNRTYDRFCSHRHFPFDKKSKFPAITYNEKAIYISSRIFTNYIEYGNRVYRQLVQKCIKMLLSKPLIEGELTPSLEVTYRRQNSKNRDVLHLINYIAEKKSQYMHIVDTLIPIYNQEISIRRETSPSKVYLAPSKEIIDFEYSNGYVNLVIPKVEGYQIVVLDD